MADIPHVLVKRVRDRARKRVEEGIATFKRVVLRMPPPTTFTEWTRLYDTLDDTKRAEILRAIEAFPKKPLISIVVPTHDPPEQFLREMIESVQAQLYPHWELCIADDASPDPNVKRILSEYAAKDPRIKVVFNTAHGHISKTTNSALAIATGDWISFADHDDTLAEHALFMAVRYINRFPNARLFYSDEDKLDFEGRRTDPYFKPDWNPDLMRAQNTFSHLGVYDATLVRELGGCREGLEGSQDHDLTLRCAERAGAAAIVHIPHILYHWRMLPGSASLGLDEKPYALLASTRVIQEHLERCGDHGVVTVAIGGTNMMRVRYDLPASLPLVSIVVPCRDRAKATGRCVESVLGKTVYPSYEIIIADNASSGAATLELFEELSFHRNVRVLRAKEYRGYNFPALVNRGARDAKGQYLVILDDDIEILSPDWLHELISQAMRPQIGAVGPAIWYPDDTLQSAGIVVGVGSLAGSMNHRMPRGRFGQVGRAVLAQNVTAVSAACLAVQKSLWDEVGGLNETDLATVFHDIDFCLRLRKAGRRNVYAAGANVRHHDRNGVRSADRWARHWREADWMRKTWGSAVEADAAYNPNMTTEVDRLFDLAFPPRVEMLE